MNGFPDDMSVQLQQLPGGNKMVMNKPIIRAGELTQNTK